MAKYRRSVIGRDVKGHFARLDKRKKQRLILLVNGRYNKETKEYVKHKEREIIKFEFSKIRKVIEEKVFVSISVKEMKANAVDYQEYNESILEDTGQVLYGDFKMLDGEKKFILDNVTSEAEAFNSILVAYEAEDGQIHYITLALDENQQYHRFDKIYNRIDLKKLEEQINKLAKRQGYPTSIRILAIELRDVSAAKYALTDGIKPI